MPFAIDPITGKQRRGFAGMDPDKRRAIASKGGSSTPAEKRAYAVDRDLAASAGRKGGEASAVVRQSKSKAA